MVLKTFTTFLSSHKELFHLFNRRYIAINKEMFDKFTLKEWILKCKEKYLNIIQNPNNVHFIKIINKLNNFEDDNN